MRRLVFALLLAFLPFPALAALKVGDKAPEFTAPATLGGKRFTFTLSEALKNGPVVVYFYPAAFTTGCTIEAHNFAVAMPQYRSLGASVIGLSKDNMETLDKFSQSECQSQFPVASDADRKIMKGYDAALGFLTPYADRISYVVGQDGRIAFVHADLDPDQHVSLTLKAVAALKGRK
jgi:peroxiredoxin Q/BCP